MTHVALMHNPDAGNKNHKRAELMTLLRDAGFKPRYQSTNGNYDQALARPGDFIIAAGGDGTVRKIAKHLVGSGTPLAILPLGTANNIATSLGIAGETRDLIVALASARVKKFDVGVAKGPWGKNRISPSGSAHVRFPPSRFGIKCCTALENVG